MTWQVGIGSAGASRITPWSRVNILAATVVVRVRHGEQQVASYN